MKQRLGLAAAFFTKPELVILDEPTSGMDPAGIQEIRALIVDLAKREGVTIILASHQLDEVKRVCDRVAILSKGKIAAEGAVDALTAGQARLRLVVTRSPRYWPCWALEGRPTATTPCWPTSPAPTPPP
jgi:ABC-2 type transport system ATP-binding protein